jgi:glycosyltransferase involved in cell wall biosynthesis
MRILLLNYEYPPLGGGAGKATEQLLYQLAKQSEAIEVDAVVSSDGSEQTFTIFETATIYKLNIGKSRNIHYQTVTNLLAYIYHAYKKTKYLLSIKNYDCIHCFFAIPTGLIAWCFRHRIPFIISLRGSDVPYFNNRFRFLYPFLKPVLRCICNSASYIVANSNGLRQLMLKTYPDMDIRVIPNGIDVSSYFPAQKNLDSPWRILFVGRLIERKGITYLIDAFAETFKNSDAVLDIVGTGNIEQHLREKVRKYCIEERVIFHGELRGEALRLRYKHAHIFVLPSLNEGMSNALLEAMASELPVIVTTTVGSTELVKNSRFIVTPGSSEGIIECLQYFINNPTLIQEEGTVNREAASHFSVKSVVCEYKYLYSLLNKLK